MKLDRRLNKSEQGIIEIFLILIILLVGLFYGVTKFYPTVFSHLFNPSQDYQKINEQYFEKNGFVYYRVESSFTPNFYKPLIDATSKEFVLLRCKRVNNCFAYSGNNIYHNSQLIETLSENILDFEEVFLTDLNRKLEYYLITDVTVYFMDVSDVNSETYDANSIQISKVDGAISETIEELHPSLGYLSDKSSVFLSGQRTLIDPSTVKMAGRVAIDKNAVYLDGELLENVDHTSFIFYENDFYYKDKNYVYSFDMSIVEEADPNTFTLTDKWTATDNSGKIYTRDVLTSPFELK